MPSQDASRDYDLLDRLVEEFNERFRKGERPSLEEYCDRYPELADDLRELLPALAQVEQAKDGLAQEVEALAPTAAALQHLGDFRILREVGRGGVGVVYEAEQVSLGRRVALKVLTDRMMRDDRQKQRFEREARAAARLHHTNIVPVFGAGEAEGIPYYVMQFIQGMGLDAVVEELGRLSSGTGVPAVTCTDQTPVPRQASLSLERVARSLLCDAFPRQEAHEERGAIPGHASLQPAFPRQSVARIGIQVADALEYAHKQGVVHRDIKPSNLLLDLNGTVWVTDFGLAKAEGGENLTHPGDILGTLRYVPPEAFDGKADFRGDVYSLGLTLYELVALRPAFDQRDRNHLLKQVTTAEVQPLGTLRRGVPRDLETIIHKAIDRDPARRYQTAGELRDDLRRFVDDEPILARRQTLLERYVRWARHNPTIAVLGAVLTAVLVLTTLASLIVADRMSEMYQKEVRRAAVERKALEVRTKIDRADAQIAEGDLHWKAGRLAEWRRLSRQGIELLREAVRLAPSDSLEQQLGTARLGTAHVALADQFAELGLWAESAAEFRLALEHVGYDAKHNDEDIWWEAGLTFLFAGDQDSYRHCVKEGLRLRAETNDPVVAQRLLHLMVLDPNSPGNPSQRDALAAVAMREPIANWLRGYALLAAGAAHYRTGNAARAVALLTECRGSSGGECCLANADSFLALALHKLGQLDEAKAALRSATLRIDKTEHTAPVLGRIALPFGLAYATITSREALHTVLGRDEPYGPYLRLLRGRSYARLGEQALAEAEFAAAVKARPDDPDLATLRAQIERGAGR